jgi:hypothetical protein
MSDIQSVIIDKRLFSLAQAINYINLHGYKLKKIDETTNFYRFRQLSPKLFKKYFIKDLHNGVKLVVGFS